MLQVSSCSSASSYSLSWVWASATRAEFSSSPLSFSSRSLWLSCSSLRNSYSRNTRTVSHYTQVYRYQVTWWGQGSHKDVWPCAWLWPVPAFGSPRARPARLSSGTDSDSDPDGQLMRTSPKKRAHTQSRQRFNVLTTLWSNSETAHINEKKCASMETNKEKCKEVRKK